MLYSPKCPRGCVVAKGQWKGKPRTPAQALHWSNHLTALLSQLPNYGWKENTRNYVKPTPTANLSSEHGCSTWAMLPDWGSQSRSGNVPFMALVPGFAVTFQACSIMLNSWTTRLSWAGATEATRVWAGAAKKAQDALRLSELAWIVPSEAQQLPASRHWDATQWKYMFVLMINQGASQLYLFACVKDLKLHLAVMSFIHANLIAHGGVG